MFNIPAEHHEDFNDWYESDHIPLLMQCKEWLMVRRMRIADGVPGHYTHMALHYGGRNGAAIAGTRSRQKDPMARPPAKNDWFKASYSMFDRLGPRQIGKLSDNGNT